MDTRISGLSGMAPLPAAVTLPVAAPAGSEKTQLPLAQSVQVGAGTIASGRELPPLLAQALAQWQEQLQEQRNLEFSIDDDSGRSVVRVIDGESGEVIRQFPTEEVLQLARQAARGEGGLIEALA